MPDILKAYKDLSTSSSRSDVSDVLNSIVEAPPFSFTRSSRTELLKELLQDLKVCSKGRLATKDAAHGLLAVKTLAKDPAGSEFLASSTNLSTLLSLSSTFKDDAEASAEALRCIANTVLLIDHARTTFIEKSVNGGEICITLLEKTNSPEHIFIISRIMFLSTASGPPFLLTMMDEKYHGRHITEILSAKLDSLLVSILSSTKMAKEAMGDLLKFIFNILLHYPKMVETEPQNADALHDERKVLGDFWSSKLDGLLPPLIRVFISMPSSFPSPVAAPLTHVIHALITIPITPSLHPLWFGNTGTSKSTSNNNSPKSSTTQTPQSQEASGPHSRSTSPSRVPQPSTIDRALLVLSGGRRSLSRSSSPNTGPTNVLQRALDLLEVSFSHFFPGTSETDETEVRERAKKDTGDSSLDDVLSPLVALIARFCVADEASRIRARQVLVPDNLDRNTALEGRPDLLGRCLRLLSSVYHPRLKDAVGEMLFAMADSNATTLCALVGYGNVAGFLFHKGIMSAPTSDSNASLTTPEGAAIDPITGTTAKKAELPEMSDEEKEREMEKLFVLFDRLEKNGAIPPSQNPMRKALQGPPRGN